MRRTAPITTAVTLALLMGAVCVAHGADDQPNKFHAEPSSANLDLTYTQQWPEPPDTGALLLRLGIGTVLVLGLCVGTMWFGRRWLQRLPGGVAGGRKLQVEDVVTLGNRAALYLVKVGDTQLVAGTDASGLKSLLALPTQFQEVLAGQIGTNDETGSEPVDTHASFTDRSRERSPLGTSSSLGLRTAVSPFTGGKE